MMEEEIQQQKLTFKWSAYFTATEQFQKSLVFNTKDESKKIILVQTDMQIYVFVQSNDNLQKIANAPSKDMPDVKQYVPFAYEILSVDTSEKPSHYIFYFASNIPSKKGTTRYVISRMIIDIKLKEITNTTLFKHYTPIMHLGIIKNNNEEYLVAGSLYPTIKIYDITPNKEKAVATLYNRFLLGTTIDNTLLDARKEENDRRKTAFTRWLYKEKDINKTYTCTLHTLTNSFDTQYEQSKDILIEIDKDSYPLTCKNDSSLILLDRKENTIHLLKSADQTIQSIIAEPLALKLEKGAEKTITNIIESKQYLKDIFSGEDFAHYIKSQITHENYVLFLQDPEYTHHDNNTFFYWLFSKIIKTIMNDTDAVMAVAGKIQHDYGNALFRGKIAKSFFEGIDLHIPTTYQTLQQHFTPNILHHIHENFFGSLFSRNHIKVFMPFFVEKAKNICANDSPLFLQTDQAIWQLDFETKKFKSIYQIKDQDNPIENIFAADNGLYMITKDKLVKIDLSKKQELISVD